MSGHRKWSEVRRSLSDEDQARVGALAQRMAFEERLEGLAATDAERLRDVLGLPADMEISYSHEPVERPQE